MSAPNTPLRRSRRGQPVFLAPSSSGSPDLVSSDVLYSRPTCQSDLLDDESPDLDFVLPMDELQAELAELRDEERRNREVLLRQSRARSGSEYAPSDSEDE